MKAQMHIVRTLWDGGLSALEPELGGEHIEKRWASIGTPTKVMYMTLSAGNAKHASRTRIASKAHWGAWQDEDREGCSHDLALPIEALTQARNIEARWDDSEVVLRRENTGELNITIRETTTNWM